MSLIAIIAMHDRTCNAAEQPLPALGPLMERHLEIEWVGLPENPQTISGKLELTAGIIDKITILEGQGTVTDDRWKIEPVGPRFRVRVDLRVPPTENKLKQTGNKVEAHAAILTVRANAEAFSFFPIDVKPGQDIVPRDMAVLVTTAGNPARYHEAATEIPKAGNRTLLQKLAEEPEWTAEIAAQKIPAPAKSDTVLGLDRNWESFWVSVLGNRISLEERDTGEGEPTYDPYARLPDHQRHFLTGPVSLDNDTEGRPRALSPTNCTRSLECRHLPMLNVSYTAAALHYDIAAFAGTLLEPLTPEVAAKEPTLAVFYRSEVCNTGNTPASARFILHPTVMPTGVKTNVPPSGRRVDDSGRLASDEYPGKIQAIAWTDGEVKPQDDTWTVTLEPGQKAAFHMIMPYTPQPPEVMDKLMHIDFKARREAVCRYWSACLADAMQINVPEQQLNDDYISALIHCLLRVYPGRYQAEAKPFYKYQPQSPDYGVWNGRFCPIASESMPMIHFFDLAGLPSEFVAACLQYYYNRQCDDGRLQMTFYDIETPWVLWGSWEHFRMTGDAAWARRIAPQMVKACDWIIMQRRVSYREPEGVYGRGLFSGHTADDAPLGGGRNFMFNGYMYMGLHAAGQLLQAIGNPEADRMRKEAELYGRDILAALEEAVKRAPLIRLGDGFWWPAIPPQHNIRGLANWVGFFSHGGFYVHDSELGPLHTVFAGVLDARDRRANDMLQVLSEVVLKESGIPESQPAYSKHAYVLLQRGDVNNFLRAFYMLRYFQADRETGTWWEHTGGTGSPHKTHEEAWWVHHLRWLLVLESGNDLRLCAGIPRRWLKDRNAIAVKNAVTLRGRISFEIHSNLADDSTVTARISLRPLEGSVPQPPGHFILRLPHPDRKQLKAVRVGGQPWTDFDPAMETITLPADQASLDIIATYR